MPEVDFRQPGLRHFPNLQQHFVWSSNPGGGFMFDVDLGNREVIITSEQQKQNYELALKAVKAGAMTDEGPNGLRRRRLRPRHDFVPVRTHC